MFLGLSRCGSSKGAIPFESRLLRPTMASIAHNNGIDDLATEQIHDLRETRRKNKIGANKLRMSFGSSGPIRALPENELIVEGTAISLTMSEQNLKEHTESEKPPEWSPLSIVDVDAAQVEQSDTPIQLVPVKHELSFEQTPGKKSEFSVSFGDDVVLPIEFLSPAIPKLSLKNITSANEETPKKIPNLAMQTSPNRDLWNHAFDSNIAKIPQLELSNLSTSKVSTKNEETIQIIRREVTTCSREATFGSTHQVQEEAKASPQFGMDSPKVYGERSTPRMDISSILPEHSFTSSIEAPSHPKPKTEKSRPLPKMKVLDDDEEIRLRSEIWEQRKNSEKQLMDSWRQIHTLQAELTRENSLIAEQRELEEHISLLDKHIDTIKTTIHEEENQYQDKVKSFSSENKIIETRLQKCYSGQQVSEANYLWQSTFFAKSKSSNSSGFNRCNFVCFAKHLGIRAQKNENQMLEKQMPEMLKIAEEELAELQQQYQNKENELENFKYQASGEKCITMTDFQDQIDESESHYNTCLQTIQQSEATLSNLHDQHQQDLRAQEAQHQRALEELQFQHKQNLLTETNKLETHRTDLVQFSFSHLCWLKLDKMFLSIQI